MSGCPACNFSVGTTVVGARTGTLRGVSTALRGVTGRIDTVTGRIDTDSEALPVAIESLDCCAGNMRRD